MDQVLLAFWNYARTHYRTPDGKTTSQLREYELVIKAVRNLYATDELSTECVKPDSPLAFLDTLDLSAFTKGIEDAERALHNLLPPCDYHLPSPVELLRSYQQFA